MKRINTAITVCILAYFLVVALWYSVSAPLDHDEHQFMASAFLVARYGWQPYQDFAYFHMPNLVYLYALFFLLPHPFMLARLFNGLCGFGLCLAIFIGARSVFADENTLKRIILPIAAAALLLHSPLFVDTSARVWNHASSTLCVVVAFFCLCRAIRAGNALWYFFLSGLGLGMAIGIRLTFAPVILPFLVTVIFRGGTFRDKGLHVVAFTLGGLLANLPAVYFLFTAFNDFIFDNLGYAAMNTIYREGMPAIAPMTFVDKIKYLKNFIFGKPGELVIVIATLYSVGLLGIEKIRRVAGRNVKFEIVILSLVLPFVYLGSIAPTPSWYQYYFALLPFMILLSLFAVSSLADGASRDAASVFIVVAAVISIAYGSPGKNAPVIRSLMSPGSWTPNTVQRAADNISAFVGNRPGGILTLSPLYAILAGMPIYKEFVTGPFAWRVSYLLSEEDALKRGLPVPRRIRSFLEERHPRAILTGADEKQLEAPLISAAQLLKYQPTMTASGVVAWLSPK